MATAEEKRYMGMVASLGCKLCRMLGFGDTPPQVHHMRTGVGAGNRASNFDVIPLCLEHHTGNTGIHGLGRKRFEREYGVTERDLVEQTQQEVFERFGVAANGNHH